MIKYYSGHSKWAMSLRYSGQDEEVRNAVVEMMRFVDQLIAGGSEDVLYAPDGSDEFTSLTETTLLQDLHWYSDDLFMDILDGGDSATGILRKKYDLIIKAIALIELAERESQAVRHG